MKTFKIYRKPKATVLKRKMGKAPKGIFIEYDPEFVLRWLAKDVRTVFGISDDEWFSTNKMRQVVYPRHIFNKVACDHNLSSLIKIGEMSGIKDHSTIRHSWSKANDLIYSNEPMFFMYFKKYLKDGDPAFTNFYTNQNSENATNHSTHSSSNAGEGTRPLGSPDLR